MTNLVRTFTLTPISEVGLLLFVLLGDGTVRLLLDGNKIFSTPIGNDFDIKNSLVEFVKNKYNISINIDILQDSLGIVAINKNKEFNIKPQPIFKKDTNISIIPKTSFSLNYIVFINYGGDALMSKFKSIGLDDLEKSFNNKYDISENIIDYNSRVCVYNIKCYLGYSLKFVTDKLIGMAYANNSIYNYK